MKIVILYNEVAELHDSRRLKNDRINCMCNILLSVGSHKMMMNFITVAAWVVQWNMRSFHI